MKRTVKHGEKAAEPTSVSVEDTRGLIRYQMMSILVGSTSLAADELAEILSMHQEFIATGGGGGRWQTVVTPGETETGLIIGVYLEQTNKEATGKQASLEHKRLDGLDLRGVQLPYANLCGASAHGQDLSKANLAGSLATDSDFTGACFREAFLVTADFSRSDLAGCDFRKADLSGTDFEQADLTGADMRGAFLTGASFKNALTAGVKWPTTRKKKAVAQKATEAESPTYRLCEAAAHGDLNAAEAALEAGADVNAPGPADLTALDHAVANGQIEMVKYLLKRGANITSTTLIVADKSAYSSPWLLNFLQLAQLKQLKPKTKWRRKQDVRLLVAAHEGDLGTLREAIEKGADVNVTDEQDNTAIRWAARGGHIEVVRTLLDAGANVDGRSGTGWTALLEAVLAGHEDVAALLVERGADVNAKILTGASLLYLAKDVVRFSEDQERAERIAALLESRGAEFVEPQGDEEEDDD